MGPAYHKEVPCPWGVPENPKPSQGDSCPKVSNQDLPAEVEIFNTYGEFSNDKLLQDYGFILAPWTSKNE